MHWHKGTLDESVPVDDNHHTSHNYLMALKGKTCYTLLRNDTIFGAEKCSNCVRVEFSLIVYA